MPRADAEGLVGRVVRMSQLHPSWEKTASLLFLLGVFFGCASVFNRFLFSMGEDITEALFLLEATIPCAVLVVAVLLRADACLGFPISPGRFADRTVLAAVLPSAVLFGLRNVVPAYAMSLSKRGNIRDFVFCTRLLQPILIFVLEGCVTRRRVWRWHVLSLFMLLAGISLFLFHTFDPEVASTAVPLLGAQSNPFATVLNLLSVGCGAGFFTLFARQSTALHNDRPWVPLQDLVAAHFVVGLCVEVLAAAFTGGLHASVRTLASMPTPMLQRVAVSAVLNGAMLLLRMLCLAKTSCILTALVPTFFIIPVRLLMGTPVLEGTSVVGAVLATVGMGSFLVFSLTEVNSLGGPPAAWVAAILNTSQRDLALNLGNCVGSLYGVALFCALFPIACKLLFGLSTSYIAWSVLLFAIPLAALTHEGVSKRQSVAALYACIGLLMFSFLPLQFGPVHRWAAVACFVLELVVLHVVGAGLDALQLLNGYRPGCVLFANRAAQAEAEAGTTRHGAELDDIANRFVIVGRGEEEEGDEEDDDEEEGEGSGGSALAPEDDRPNASLL